MAHVPSVPDGEHLAKLRLGLVRLHKALLENERVRYERLYGRIEEAFAFLTLAANDPWFSWLRPFTQLIVQFDERLDQEAPLSAADAKLLEGELRSLIAPTGETGEFHEQYREALQANPEVVMLHAALMRDLGGNG